MHNKNFRALLFLIRMALYVATSEPAANGDNNADLSNRGWEPQVGHPALSVVKSQKMTKWQKYESIFIFSVESVCREML